MALVGLVEPVPDPIYHITGIKSVFIKLLFSINKITKKLLPAQHNKVYSMQEFNQRLQIFTENKRRIDKHNEGNHSFTSKNNLMPFYEIFHY